MKRLMVMMAKQPEAGKTKTRLMPAVSAGQAAALYQCFLQDKIKHMCQVRDVQLAIAYYPSSANHYFASLAPDFLLIEQTGVDLPARLKHVTRTVFERNYDCLVSIDGDTVTLPPEYLQEALDRLYDPEIDVTLGPCEDGGYYAIGMKAPHLSLFDVQMSTPDVTTHTLKQVQNAGLKASILPEWWDVDTPADLERLQADLDNHPHLVTTSFLKGLHV